MASLELRCGLLESGGHNIIQPLYSTTVLLNRRPGQRHPVPVYRGQERQPRPLLPLLRHQQAPAGQPRQQPARGCAQHRELERTWTKFCPLLLQVSGRLHISLTKVYDGANLVASHFSSKQEVIDVSQVAAACCRHCHCPLLRSSSPLPSSRCSQASVHPATADIES